MRVGRGKSGAFIKGCGGWDRVDLCGREGQETWADLREGLESDGGP